MKTTTTLRLALGLAAVGTVALLAQIPGEGQTRQVMKFKLHYTQSALEGIATENYALITTNALQLSRLTQAAGWEYRQTPDYQRLSAEFRRSADRLADAGKRRNVDAATVAYFELTLSCVSCHKYLREARFAGLPGTLSAPPRTALDQILLPTGGFMPSLANGAGPAFGIGRAR